MSKDGHCELQTKRESESATANLEFVAERIRQVFSQRDASREKTLRLCRESIRFSANAIRQVHRGEFDVAQESLNKVRSLLYEVDNTLDSCPDLWHAGFVHDAQKEFAEGCITLALVAGDKLPEPEELGVSPQAYLNGMGEAVGELRRHLLDTIRKGDLYRCEELLSDMDDIFSVLVTMDFPDALTCGLRRTTDLVRGILEKTRGDLTLAIRQRDFEAKLDEFERRNAGKLLT